MKRQFRLLILVCLVAAAAAAMASAAGRPAAGTFYFTTYGSQPAPGAPAQRYNLWRVRYSFNGSRFRLFRPVGVAQLPTADGVVSAPDGSLLVANGPVYRVNRRTGAFQRQPQSSAGSCADGEHLVVAPNGSKAYTSGQPGPLVVVPLRPFGPSMCRALRGDDTTVTGVAFDSRGNAFYTSSGPGGGGTFGRIDLRSFATRRKYSALPAAHGILFDRFSGNLVLVGSSHVTQIDPRTLRIVSDRNMAKDPCSGRAACGVVFDQGATDDAGHLFIASNDGHLAFLDISRTRRVAGRRTFVALPFLMATLDDTDSRVLTTRPPGSVKRPSTTKPVPKQPSYTG